MRERGLVEIGICLPSQSFWVATFSTGMMGTFQPVLTSALQKERSSG
jgi:hypothetical protein